MDALRAFVERWGLTRAEVSGLLVAALGAVVAVLVALRLPLGSAIAGSAPPVAPVLTEAPMVSPTPSEVVVHVAGAVTHPGLVRLAAGARVADAVDAAGGPAEDAGLDGLNLARALVDGERIAVPTLEEVAAGVVVAPTDGLAGAASSGQLADGRLDLNTATTGQLEELPGVGPVLAGRIIAHRDDRGGFDEAVALREVSGIGEATWAGLRDLVGVAGEAG